MPPPTQEQLQLIKDHEPVLFFHGGDATVPAERFFPSDAKRYLERCSLWKATAPFLTRADWGSPVVETHKLCAIEGEDDVYLGKGLPSGPFDFLETPADKECFLDLAGWKAPGSPFPAADRYANLDRIAELYSTDDKLKRSQFWYHAEVFDAARLRRLFNSALESGDNVINFVDLFAGPKPSLTDPVLLCYYLFYPGHDEGLSDCPGIDQAKEFGSFAGEWTCVAILLDRPSPTEARAPKWLGLSNRNTGTIRVGDKEVRTGFRVLPWSAAELFQNTHPRLAVARGSHAFYLTTEQPSAVGPLTSPDMGADSCGRAEAPASEIPPLPDEDSTLDDIFGVVKGIFIMVAKIAIGAGIGSILGPVGAAVGGLAGLVAGALENSSGLSVVGTGPTGPAGPTVDTVNITSGKVAHPKGMRPPDVDASRSQEWQSEPNATIDGRRYDSVVDRETQILWPGDPEFKGYTGRWGPRMESDAQTRRAGMKFPNFWLIFFDALVRKNPPSIVQFLAAGTTTWTVPANWNNANNKVECIGAGGGGTGAWTDNNIGGWGGGGGAYAKSVNLTLTPGATVTVNIGAGSAGGPAAAGGGNSPAGGDTWFNSAAFPTSGQACGARGAAAHTGSAAGAGGLAANSYSTGPDSITRSGGNGGEPGGSGIAAGGGGGGAGGPAGDGAVGGAALGATPGVGGTGDSTNTAAGANGTQFDSAHGAGGGGNGGNQSPGAAGGLYGAGGGGGGFVSLGTGHPGGKGADGLIVITFTP